MAEIPEDADILPPSDDRIFKVLLTHPDAKPVLISVISTAIEQPVIDVQVRNTELPATDINEKAQRFDVNCTVDGGDQVNVEMQCSPVEEDTKHKIQNMVGTRPLRGQPKPTTYAVSMLKSKSTSTTFPPVRFAVTVGVMGF